jgi:hypothetical protein
MVNKDLNALEFFDRIQREQNTQAQNWWLFARGSQIVVLVVASAMTFSGRFLKELDFILLVITVLCFALQWYSDILRRRGQALLRRYEFWHGLGWAPTERELADLQISLPSSIKSKLKNSPSSLEAYYASDSPQSYRRLIEDLAESTWWSKHIAERSTQILAALTATVLLGAILIFYVTLQSKPDPLTADIVSRLVISVVVFMFSAGYVRLTWEYYSFYLDAKDIEAKACDMLDRANEIDAIPAIKLYHDYQIARAGSPPLLSALWKCMRRELQGTWDQYRRK